MPIVPPHNTTPTPLIQIIEYDWALVARCRVCGHTARWGAEALVERFRDQLRATMGDVGAALAKHCGQQPVVYLINGGGMEPWREQMEPELKDPWAFRDHRLRAFLVEHGLPLDLADERKAAADAWLEEHSHGRPKPR